VTDYPACGETRWVLFRAIPGSPAMVCQVTIDGQRTASWREWPYVVEEGPYRGVRLYGGLAELLTAEQADQARLALQEDGL
jgi:hypothetical protein